MLIAIVLLCVSVAAFAEESNPAPNARGAIQSPQAEPASAPDRAAPLQMAAEEFSYEDRQKLHQIEREIERLSGSGNPSSNQQRIEALIRRQELIYSKYGTQASPRVVLQDQRPRPR